MARLNKNGTLSGLMGDVVMRAYNNTTYVYVRQEKVNNPQTRGQMVQRTKKQNIVNLYGALKPALKDNFQGKVGKQSDYTMFVSCNLSQQPVYLTSKEASADYYSVVAPYIVAFGKLSPIEYSIENEWLVSNIIVGNVELNNDTKVCELANMILSYNAEWKEGDTLEFIICKQNFREDASGETVNVRAECEYANIVLDNGDKSKLSRYLDNIELKADGNGCLCLHASSYGGYAIVQKRKTAKDVATGVQSLAVVNPLLEKYTSEEQCEKAIKSYGKKH
mgnify:FL=1